MPCIAGASVDSRVEALQEDHLIGLHVGCVVPAVVRTVLKREHLADMGRGLEIALLEVLDLRCDEILKPGASRIADRERMVPDRTDERPPDVDQCGSLAEQVARVVVLENLSNPLGSRTQRVVVVGAFNRLADAGLLARRTGARLLVLHVVHDLEHAPGYYQRAWERAGLAGRSAQILRLDEAARELMDEFIAQVGERHPEISLGDLETMLVVGVPATRILEVGEKAGARHIVMGSRGRTGVAHMLLGSKAEQVVRLSSVPVTIVKSPAPGAD